MTITPDHMSHVGATTLAHQIRIYWRKRGYAVITRIEVHPDTGMHCVRSNMIDGWPVTHEPVQLERTYTDMKRFMDANQ